MSRTLALLVTVVFVGWLFKLDPRKKSEITPALWLPTIWMMIIGSRMVSGWFSVDAEISAESYADGSSLDRNIFLVLIVLALIVVIRRRINLQQLLRNNTALVVFFAYCAISIAWSDFPVVSLKRYIKEIGNLLMAMIVLSEPAPLQAIYTVIKRCAYVLVPFSILLFKYYSELGRAYSRWTGDLSVIGVTNNKNSLGVLCSICAIGLFASLLQMWSRGTFAANKKCAAAQAIVLAMTVWLLVLAHSATSIGCCVVAISIMLAVRVTSIRRNIGVWACIALIVVATVYVSGSLVSMTAGTLGRDETLTGRTEIWSKVIAMNSNPLIGVGYSSFWLGPRMEEVWKYYAWHPTEAHNGYIEVYLDLGFIGVGLLAVVIIAAFRRTFSLVHASVEVGGFVLAILVAAVLYNITESAFRAGLLMYFVFMIVIVNMPAKKRRVVPSYANEQIAGPAAEDGYSVPPALPSGPALTRFTSLMR